MIVKNCNLSPCHHWEFAEWTPLLAGRKCVGGNSGDMAAKAHKGQGPITLHLLLLITTGRITIQLLHYLRYQYSRIKSHWSPPQHHSLWRKKVQLQQYADIYISKNKCKKKKSIFSTDMCIWDFLLCFNGTTDLLGSFINHIFFFTSHRFKVNN